VTIVAYDLDEVRRAPRDGGTVELVVSRPGPGERRVLAAGQLDLDVGLVGDTWSTRRSRVRPDGSLDTTRQLTVMSARAIALVASSPQDWALAGDQLFVDLDLSEENLPAGARLAVGTAVIEVSAAPHNGCAKFTRRFGPDAIRLVNSPEGRALRLRGLNARVVEPGTVRRGDPVAKVAAAGLSTGR
jgi:hypothetical protein